MIPRLEGRPIRVRLHPSLGAHYASTSIPGRLILIDASLLARRGEFDRILVHELFHFVWVRLGNQARFDWEQILAREIRLRARGELGWSAESAKKALTLRDRRQRTQRWREYACESFCDTAAWLYSGLRKHEEFSLKPRWRLARRRFFLGRFSAGCVPI